MIQYLGKLREGGRETEGERIGKRKGGSKRERNEREHT